MKSRTFREYSDSLYKSYKSADEEKINFLFEEIRNRFDGKSSIYFMGNGGSAANASHICGDYLKTFAMLNQNLKIFNITDSVSYYTAAVNDTDQSEVFSLLVGKLISKEDLIICLSGSGNSINLVKAAQKAKKMGAKIISITSYTGGALKNISDISIFIDINDMEIAEDAQLSIFHHIKQKLTFYLENQNMDLDNTFKKNKYMNRINNNLIA